MAGRFTITAYSTMKKQSITFTFTIDVAYEDHLCDDWIGEQYLSSDRFSTLSFPGEPGSVLATSTGIEKHWMIGVPLIT